MFRSLSLLKTGGTATYSCLCSSGDCCRFAQAWHTCLCHPPRQCRPAQAKSQKREQIEREIAATDRQIDQLVYQLYGLTEDEIRIVEERPAKPAGFRVADG